MPIVVALIVLAVALGILSLLVHALKWLLILAAALFVIGLVRGFLSRGRPT